MRKLKLPGQIKFTKLYLFPPLVGILFRSIPLLFYYTPYYSKARKILFSFADGLMRVSSVETIKWFNIVYLVLAVLFIIGGLRVFLSNCIYVCFGSAEVTDKDVKTHIYDVFTLNEDSMSYESMENVKVIQTLFGTVFNYGSIVVNGKGGGKIIFYMVPHPNEVAGFINKKINNLTSDEFRDDVMNG